MADKNRQNVQGGVIVDTLAKLLFKGLDNIFDAAAEYEREMGVLKQITRIPVKDKSGKQYELIIKLAPIRDKDNLFYIEVECPGFKGFDPIDDAVNKHAFKLDKSDKSKADFEDVIDQVLAKNGLKRVEKKTEDKKSDVHADSVVEQFNFFEAEVDKPESYVISVAVNTTEDKINVVVESKPPLAKSFNVTTSLDSDDRIGDQLESYVNKCHATPETEDKDRWDTLVDILNELPEWEGQVVDNIKELVASSKIKVKLEKIVANGHEDINLVSIVCSSKLADTAIDKIEDIVASDEFVDSMPEGESTYIITEDDDCYDIEPYTIE